MYYKDKDNGGKRFADHKQKGSDRDFAPRRNPSAGRNGSKAQTGTFEKRIPAPAPEKTAETPLTAAIPDAESADDTSMVYGRNSVLELLKSERTIDKLLVRRGDREGSITLIVAECLSRKIPVIEVEKPKLDALTGNMNHQGVVAMAAMKDYSSIDDILSAAAEKGEKPLIVIADEIEDPHNLGALIRCAEGAGAHGIIIPKRRSSGLTSVVAKASAGALEHLPVAKVANISAAIDELKEKGVWIYGAEAGGSAYYDTKFDSAAAIVVGSEGSGISRLVREKCDFMISIPMYGKVNSFNVSCAAAVILCEAARQLKKN